MPSSALKKNGVFRLDSEIPCFGSKVGYIEKIIKLLHLAP